MGIGYWIKRIFWDEMLLWLEDAFSNGWQLFQRCWSGSGQCRLGIPGGVGKRKGCRPAESFVSNRRP